MSISNLRCALMVSSLIVLATSSCRPAEPQKKYDLKGRVVEVDKKGRTVTVAHEAIAGYMGAMTMPFMVKDERLLVDLAEGDRLQATLAVSGLRSWLEDVVVTRESADPSSLATAGTSVEPKTGDEVPDFHLVNQNGKSFSLRHYRGQILVLTFIYVRCPLPDYCPLMTDNFAEIQTALKSDPDRGSRTRLLSITVDPEYDTPKMLREYAAAHSADSALWDFATGTKDEVKKVATYFGLRYWPEGDQIIHSLRTAIVGPDGRLVKLFRGNEWRPDEIVRELRNVAEP